MQDARYVRMKKVEETVRGIPVMLCLQKRKFEDNRVGFTISWRTGLPKSPSINRKFYWMNQDGGWRIPLSSAMRLLNKAEQSGFFNSLYDDSFLRFRVSKNDFTVYTSQNLDSVERQKLFEQITFENGEVDWGPNPEFIVAEIPKGDADKKWIKIIIVNTQRDLVTFRTCTTTRENAYPKDMGSGRGWWLDNTMPDTPTQVMRVFLEWLRKLASPANEKSR